MRLHYQNKRSTLHHDDCKSHEPFRACRNILAGVLSLMPSLILPRIAAAINLHGANLGLNSPPHTRIGLLTYCCSSSNGNSQKSLDLLVTLSNMS